MILGGEPAFERVRAVLQNDPSAKELLLMCHDQTHREHIISVSFPPAALPRLVVDRGGLTDSGDGNTLIDRVVGIRLLDSKTRLSNVGRLPTSLRRDVRHNSWGWL